MIVAGHTEKNKKTVIKLFRIRWSFAEMERFTELLKKHKRTLLIAAAVLAVLIIAFVGFKLLVKVGNPKYFYNYLHDAGGSLEPEYYPEYEAEADSEVP